MEPICRPFCCHSFKIEGKVDAACVTALAVAAVALAMIGMHTLLNPTTILAHGIGVGGAHAFTVGGAALFLPVITILARSSGVDLQVDDDLPVSPSARASAPVITVDETDVDAEDGASVDTKGTVVLHETPSGTFVIRSTRGSGSRGRIADVFPGLNMDDASSVASRETIGTMEVHSTPSGTVVVRSTRGSGAGAARRPIADIFPRTTSVRSLPKMTLPQGKLLEETPFNPEAYKATLRDRALGLIGAGAAGSIAIPNLQLSGDDKVAIERAYAQDGIRNVDPDSGEHIVFKVDQFPHLIFKINRARPYIPRHAQAYVQMRTDARALCERNDWNLLQVPHCDFFTDSEGRVIIVEECAPLNGNFAFQQGLWYWIQGQDDLQPYQKLMLEQLTKFVCEFKLGDVKLNNVPIGDEGRLVLVDLDRESAVKGLTRGGATGDSNGLFHLPFRDKLQADLRQLARRHLDATENAAVDAKNNEVFERLSRRAKKRRLFQAYLARKGVQEISTSIPTDRVDEGDATAFLTYLNARLATAVNLDLAVGRRVEVDFDADELKRITDPETFLQDLEGKHIHRYRVEERMAVIFC